METTIPSKNVTLTSEKNTISFLLNDRAILGGNYDIRSIQFKDVPGYILNVQIMLPSLQRLIFETDQFHELAKIPFYTSQCTKFYEQISLEIVINKEWLRGREKREMVEECVEEDVYEGNEVVTIYDGHEYHRGHIVTKTHRMEMKEKIVEGVEIMTPEIILHIEKNTSGAFYEGIRVPFRQKIKSPETTAEYRKHLEEKYELKRLDDEYCLVTNQMCYFGNGLIGVLYHFEIPI